MLITTSAFACPALLAVVMKGLSLCSYEHGCASCQKLCSIPLQLFRLRAAGQLFLCGIQLLLSALQILLQSQSVFCMARLGGLHHTDGFRHIDLCRNAVCSFVCSNTCLPPGSGTVLSSSLYGVPFWQPAYWLQPELMGTGSGWPLPCQSFQLWPMLSCCIKAYIRSRRMMPAKRLTKQVGMSHSLLRQEHCCGYCMSDWNALLGAIA